MIRSKRVPSLVVCSVLLAGACREREVTTTTASMAECVSSVVDAAHVARMSPAFVDSLSLHLPYFELFPDGVAFAAARDNHVVFTDRAFSRHVVFGRQGGGPGDLRAPMAIRATPTGLAVMEGGNKRVSFWSKKGLFQYSVPVVSTAATFAVDSLQNVYTPSNEESSYILQTSKGKVTRLWGKRLSGDGAKRAVNYWMDMVARASDGTLLVFDSSQRLIVRISADGASQQVFALPPSIERELAKETALTDKSFADMGMGGITFALREFRLTDDGRLFLRTIGKGPFALLVNPRDMSCVSLTAPTEPSAQDLITGAFAMTVAESKLFVVSATGNVVEFALGAIASKQ